MESHREVDSIAKLGVDLFLQHFFYVNKDSIFRYKEYKYELEKGLTFDEKKKRRMAVISQLFSWGILVCHIQSGELAYIMPHEAISTLKQLQGIRERHRQD